MYSGIQAQNTPPREMSPSPATRDRQQRSIKAQSMPSVPSVMQTMSNRSSQQSSPTNHTTSSASHSTTNSPSNSNVSLLLHQPKRSSPAPITQTPPQQASRLRDDQDRDQQQQQGRSTHSPVGGSLPPQPTHSYSASNVHQSMPPPPFVQTHSQPNLPTIASGAINSAPPVTYPRPMGHAQPPFMHPYQSHSVDETWQMTDDLLREIERADLAHAHALAAQHGLHPHVFQQHALAAQAAQQAALARMSPIPAPGTGGVAYAGGAVSGPVYVRESASPAVAIAGALADRMRERGSPKDPIDGQQQQGRSRGGSMREQREQQRPAQTTGPSTSPAFVPLPQGRSSTPSAFYTPMTSEDNGADDGDGDYVSYKRDGKVPYSGSVGPSPPARRGSNASSLELRSTPPAGATGSRVASHTPPMTGAPTSARSADKSMPLQEEPEDDHHHRVHREDDDVVPSQDRGGRDSRNAGTNSRNGRNSRGDAVRGDDDDNTLIEDEHVDNERDRHVDSNGQDDQNNSDHEEDGDGDDSAEHDSGTPRSPTVALPDIYPKSYSPMPTTGAAANGHHKVPSIGKHYRVGSTDQLGMRTFDTAVFQPGGAGGVGAGVGGDTHKRFLPLRAESPLRHQISRSDLSVPQNDSNPPQQQQQQQQQHQQQQHQQNGGQQHQQNGGRSRSNDNVHTQPHYQPQPQHYQTWDGGRNTIALPSREDTASAAMSASMWTDDPTAAYLQAYLQSPRPNAPIPPTPHSQTAAPSPSPLISSMMHQGARALGSPYPYPFSHMRRPPTTSFSAYGGSAGPLAGYPGAASGSGQGAGGAAGGPPSSVGYDPNHPSAIEEQLALQLQMYAMNNNSNNNDGNGNSNSYGYSNNAGVMSDTSAFSPSSTPFPGPNYNPWTFARAFGGRAAPRGRFDSTLSSAMSMHSSPSHQPVSLPSFPGYGGGVGAGGTAGRTRGRKAGKKDKSSGLKNEIGRAKSRGRPSGDAAGKVGGGAVVEKVQPPPRVQSTQPRETSPEPFSSGEETAGEDWLNGPGSGNGSGGGTTLNGHEVNEDEADEDGEYSGEEIGEDDEWVDEEEDASGDLLDLELHPDYVVSVEKRRRRFDAKWETLVQAFNALDRETDTTMALLAAPSHTSNLHAVLSRGIRRDQSFQASPAMASLRKHFRTVASRRRVAARARSASSLMERLMSDEYSNGAGGSSASPDGGSGDGRREEDLKRALETALGSLETLRKIYEVRTARWEDEMARIADERGQVELLLRQTLGVGLQNGGPPPPAPGQVGAFPL